MDNDFLLISKMKRGDEGAFNTFIHKYYGKILNYCAYHCSDTNHAEDLTQETFVRFFTKLPDYHYMGKTVNYLYTIARNLCTDYFRKNKDNLLQERLLELQNDISQSDMDKVLDKLTVQLVLDRLPDNYREIIILHYFQGLKLIEISKVLNIGLPLVKYRLKQAKLQLENLLKED